MKVQTLSFQTEETFSTQAKLRERPHVIVFVAGLSSEYHKNQRNCT